MVTESVEWDDDLEDEFEDVDPQTMRVERNYDLEDACEKLALRAIQKHCELAPP